jgi:hypothetical protein
LGTCFLLFEYITQGFDCGFKDEKERGEHRNQPNPQKHLSIKGTLKTFFGYLPCLSSLPDFNDSMLCDSSFHWSSGLHLKKTVALKT